MSAVRSGRWIVCVGLLLALPIYGGFPLKYAVAVHGLMVLLYVGLLRCFGAGFVLEGAIFVMLAALMAALISLSLQQNAEKKRRLGLDLGDGQVRKIRN